MKYNDTSLTTIQDNYLRVGENFINHILANGNKYELQVATFFMMEVMNSPTWELFFPLRQSDISNYFKIKSSHMSKTVKSLERNGFLVFMKKSSGKLEKGFYINPLFVDRGTNRITAHCSRVRNFLNAAVMKGVIDDNTANSIMEKVAKFNDVNIAEPSKVELREQIRKLKDRIKEINNGLNLKNKALSEAQQKIAEYESKSIQAKHTEYSLTNKLASAIDTIQHYEKIINLSSNLRFIESLELLPEYASSKIDLNLSLELLEKFTDIKLQREAEIFAKTRFDTVVSTGDQKLENEIKELKDLAKEQIMMIKHLVSVLTPEQKKELEYEKDGKIIMPNFNNKRLTN